MNTNLLRPNFFPGQWVDYRDFNRLSEQPDKVASLICQSLFQGGGIVVNVKEDFNVVPMDKLSVLVKPGTGLLPTGYPVSLSQEQIIDLQPFSVGPKAQTLVVGLSTQVKGRDRFEDPKDASISGYRTEAFEPNFTFSQGAPLENTIEVFRVHLPSGATSLRMATTAEEWSLAFPSETEGVIDLRFRKLIVPQTYLPTTTEEILGVRRSLYQISHLHRKLSKLYLFQDSFRTTEYLSQLHAEILSRPFQPLKVSFLLSEFADKLNHYLSSLQDHLGHRSHFDKATCLEAIAYLDGLRSEEVIPKSLDLMTLPKIAGFLERIVRYGEEKYCLLSTVEEALADIRNRAFGREDRVVLAGQVFERVDLIQTESHKRWNLKTSEVQHRKLTASFKNGDEQTLRGAFFRQGLLSMEIHLPQPERPAVVLFHQYVRRGGAKIQYELNGKILDQDIESSDDSTNCFVNRGIVIAADQVKTPTSQLRLLVEKSDLDFGFFDVAVYQPVLGVRGVK